MGSHACLCNVFTGSMCRRKIVDLQKNPLYPNVSYTGPQSRKEVAGATVEGAIGGMDEASYKLDSQWTCRLCVKSQREVKEEGETDYGYGGAIVRMQQLSDVFPMKHTFAAWGRQLVRIYELAAQLRAGGLAPAAVEQMLHTPDAEGRVTALSVLERLSAAAKDAGVPLRISTTDGPVSDTMVGAASIRLQGGSENLHCDVCGYNKVEVGGTTCTAVFHLRCLNLTLEEDEDNFSSRSTAHRQHRLSQTPAAAMWFP